MFKPLKLLLIFFAIAGCVVAVIFLVDFTRNESTIIPSKNHSVEIERQKQLFGEELFNDKQLSINNSSSCASCHDPKLAFTDGKVKSIGVNGNIALRNAPSLLNVSDAPHFMLDGAVPTLEMQAIVPIQDPNEMGISMKALIKKLKKNKNYVKTSKKLFKRDLDAWVITRSLASYQRTLVSKKSRFDDYIESNSLAHLTAQEQKGWNLFSTTLGCINCHSLPNFTNYHFETNMLTLPNDKDQGRYRITGNKDDLNKFKVPSLRNVELTAPYMHDGSYFSLKQVVKTYLAEKSNIKHLKNVTYVQKKGDVEALVAFLKMLTDTSYLVK